MPTYPKCKSEQPDHAQFCSQSAEPLTPHGKTVAQSKTSFGTVVVTIAVTVNAHSFVWYTFVVPPNATEVTVNGHFTATGGAGNHIECYILDDDGFVNFKNGDAARTYYNSGKATTGIIAALLPSGTYHLVLNNKYSLITPKAVQIETTLSYLQ